MVWCTGSASTPSNQPASSEPSATTCSEYSCIDHRSLVEARQRMFPCSLRRESCLVGRELADLLQLNSLDPEEEQSSMSVSFPLASTDIGSLTSGRLLDSIMAVAVASDGLPLVRVQANIQHAASCPSLFEQVMTTYEPILRTLLAFLPTSSILNLFHTSRYLRQYLRSYPLAWKSLSFRLPQPTNTIISPNATPDPADWQTKQFALDLLLKRVIVPMGTRLTNLDLCNTAVAGALLVGCVLEPRKETLQHVSVRGCKHVSLKYHIVPFLYQCHIEIKAWGDARDFALKSLYTYRCRHHRRRPYLPSSLARRDSDSEPTHDLIELCYQLGIWTDTAWCPTPGPRCHRRKDYHGNRAAPGTMEVWVPFDRLWRSSNRVGPSDENSYKRSKVGKLWEEIECGYDGEALGTDGSSIFAGQGKDVPTHLRRSHRSFVEAIKCDQCGDRILERCETCSIRMHCMGCRKTLCASCSFNRPLKKKLPASLSSSEHFSPDSSALNSPLEQSPSDKKDKYWWAPGATRSPNIMTDISEDPDSDEDLAGRHAVGRQQQHQHQQQQHQAPLKIKMHWCCLEPLFSGGGGVAFVGPGLGGNGSERIRAVPLQPIREYMDIDFAPADSNNEMEEVFQKFDDRVNSSIDILPYLQQPTLELQSKTCPRCLCNSCYQSFRWKVECKACKRPICKEHDFRALKVRKCGFRDLIDEREYVRDPPKIVNEDISEESHWPRDLQIPAFRPGAAESNKAEAFVAEQSLEEERQPRQVEVSEGQEWSDSGSQADGPATRDTSSAPRPHLIPSTDRSSSVASRTALPVTRGTNTILPNRDSTSTRMNMVSIASSRARSFSTSELAASTKGKGRVVEQPTSKERLLLPCSTNHPVQWQGCGAYFCQGSRSVGDTRPRCFATGKECNECGVYVCQDCMPKSTTCSCSFCDNNYFCPHCFSKPSNQSKCLREAEVRAREAKLEMERKAEIARLAQEREDREQADHILNWGGEFWAGLIAETYGYLPESQLPAASSDTPPETNHGEATLGGAEIDELDQQLEAMIINSNHNEEDVVEAEVEGSMTVPIVSST